MTNEAERMGRLERRVSQLERDQAAMKAGLTTVGKITAGVLAITGAFSTLALAVKAIVFGK